MKPIQDILNRIKREIVSGDTDALEIMLQNVPDVTLRAYLDADEGYEMADRNGNPVREGDDVWVIDEDQHGVVVEISSDSDDEYYARVELDDRIRCVYDDNMELA
jgi:hypothetical protein